MWLLFPEGFRAPLEDKNESGGLPTYSPIVESSHPTPQCALREKLSIPPGSLASICTPCSPNLQPNVSISGARPHFKSPTLQTLQCASALLLLREGKGLAVVLPPPGVLHRDWLPNYHSLVHRLWQSQAECLLQACSLQPASLIPETIFSFARNLSFLWKPSILYHSSKLPSTSWIGCCLSHEKPIRSSNLLGWILFFNSCYCYIWKVLIFKSSD